MKISVAATISALTILALTGCTKNLSQNQPQKSPQIADTKIKDEALKNALNLYSQKKAEGVDFSNGPCLGTVAPDWVLDIAHNPRQPVDNKPENQCEEFRTGSAHHFIELDPEGNLIQVH